MALYAEGYIKTPNSNQIALAMSRLVWQSL